MNRTVITCRHIHHTEFLGITDFLCDKCYQPRHERRRSNAYYTTRAIVRGIFWTALVGTISGLTILGIWVLWAVL